jgi:hypothetical protein
MSYLTDDAEEIRRAVPAGTKVPEASGPLFLIYAVLLRAKGPAVTPRDVHDAWVAWMELSGEDHDSMRPFEQLSKEVQGEDMPFTDAIRRVASAGRTAHP